MTTTVTVKARAHGAFVSLRARHNAANSSEFEIPANTSRDFHIDADHVIEVKQGEAPVEETTPEVQEQADDADEA